jgi:hypothetical protein
LPRAAVINAFEAALDAPLDNPNRDMRLKACHDWMRAVSRDNTGGYQISTQN